MNEFAVLLKECGLNKTSASQAIGVNRSTCSRWGEDAPEYAVNFFRLYAENQNLRIDNEKKDRLLSIIRRNGTVNDQGKVRRPRPGYEST